ncbi:unnamed protein product [Leuciscus chuanchicus]
MKVTDSWEVGCRGGGCCDSLAGSQRNESGELRTRTTYPVSCLARRAEKQPITGTLPPLPWPNGIALTALPSLTLLLSTPSLGCPG